MSALARHDFSALPSPPRPCLASALAAFLFTSFDARVALKDMEREAHVYRSHAGRFRGNCFRDMLKPS